MVMDNGSCSSLERRPPGVRLIEGDVFLKGRLAVEEAVGPCGLIHHLGAINGTARFDREAIDVIDVAVNGALQAIDAARRWGARLVMASSPEATARPRTEPTRRVPPLRLQKSTCATVTGPRNTSLRSWHRPRYSKASTCASPGHATPTAPGPAAGRTDRWWR